MKKETENLSIFLMGPTATGKSSLAIEIAFRIGGEIINADSMQVYRGLDIGTAKPTAEERKKIPHHLIDILPVSERLDAFKYKSLAEKAAAEIRHRGRIPIFVGGSGLYLRTLLDDLDPPPADPGLAEELRAEYASEDGFKRLAAFLLDKSPAAYRRCHPNPRRMLRAAEILILEEKLGTQPKKKVKRRCEIRNLCFVLDRTRDDLKGRITHRTGQMLSTGWIDEARRMISEGLLNSPTARQAIGYRIIARHLAGEISFEEMRNKIISETLGLAKRQRSWFRNKHKDATVIALPDEENKLLDIHVNNISRHKDS
jgi:tRNA dimethylallyltransferase